MFCSSFGRYARGSNQLKDDNCRVVIIWGKPVEPEPTYEKPLQYQIHEHFNDYFLKKEINLNFQQFWYGLKPRKSIHQIVGRLTRSTNDFGFFIICSKENLENVIDKQTRSDLDIISVTRDEEDVLDAMEDFFQGVNSINGRY
jgi:Rad3-related DNA helicase